MKRCVFVMLALAACQRTEVLPVDATISVDGLSGAPSSLIGARGDSAVLADLRAKLNGLDITVGTLGPDDHGARYFSVRQGEREVAQVLRFPPWVRVIDRLIPTTDGIHVGDPVSTLLVKRPNAVCAQDTDDAENLACYDGGLLFALGAHGFPAKRTHLVPASTLATRPIRMIESLGAHYTPVES